MLSALPRGHLINALRCRTRSISSSRTQKRVMTRGMSASWGYSDMPSQKGKTFVVTVSCMRSLPSMLCASHKESLTASGLGWFMLALLPEG